MAYKIGISSNYKDMLKTIHKFTQSANMIDEPVYNPANTGLGYVSADWADDSSGVVLDTWTITYVEDSGGDYFTVSGADSTHGLQSNLATVDIPYVSDSGEIGFTMRQGSPLWVDGDVITIQSVEGMGSTAAWTTNRMNFIYDSMINYGVVSATKGNIGNPNYDIYSPEETWTITCTSVDSSGTAYFSVEGSVTGEDSGWAQCTTEIAYDNDFVSFTITEGVTDWEVDDVITFDVPIYSEIQWEGHGNAGTESIYMGIRTHEVTGIAEPVYQWQMTGNTGFNANVDWESQPGGIQYSVGQPLRDPPRCIFQDNPMPYWLVGNGRRIMMYYLVDTVIQCMHMGFLLSYALPTENPYPLAIGGTTCDADMDFTQQAVNHAAFYDCALYDSNDLYNSTFRIFDGTNWNNIANQEHHYSALGTDNGGPFQGSIWPYASGVGTTHSFVRWNSLTSNFDGSYSLMPLIPMRRYPTPVVFGEIQGLYAVSGLGLNSMDTAIIGGVNYVFFPNTYRVDQNRWCCLKLE